MEKKKIDVWDIDLLLTLSQLGALWEPISLSIERLMQITNQEQKNVDKYIERLLDLDLILLIEQNTEKCLRISYNGRQFLRKIHGNLHNLFYQDLEKRTYTGIVTSGFGTGRDYVGMDYYYSKFFEILGKSPFLGTLNIMLVDEDIEDFYKERQLHKPLIIQNAKTEEREYWRVDSYDSLVYSDENESKKIACLLLGFVKEEHERGTIEIISNFELRKELKLKDGSPVKIRFAG